MNPALEGALIALGGTALGGIATGLAGLFQSRAHIKAMKLQLAGTRDDALWQERRRALAKCIGDLESGRLKIAHLVNSRDMSAAQAIQIFGPQGGWDPAFTEATEAPKTWTLSLAEVRLAVPPEHSDRAAELSESGVALLLSGLAVVTARMQEAPEASALRAQYQSDDQEFQVALRTYAEATRVYLEERS